MAYYKVGEKQLYLVFLVYLTLSLIASSTFSIIESWHFDYSDNDCLSSGRYLTSISQTFDWLAGDILRIRKPRDNSNSQFRNRLLRVFALDGIIAIAASLSEVSLKIKKGNFPIIKDPVPLILRI